jgi:predicted ABC-type transport system involved in lysophospholipase L1 biosynthesis ATPase subunit
MSPEAAHIEVRGLTMAYGNFVIQRDLTFTIRRGDIFIIMGGSGCGKSTLLRHLIGLQDPARGEVLIEGEDLWTAAPEDRQRLKRRFGVLFQSGGLWSSMTLAENVALPLEVYSELSPSQIRQVVALKLALVGLAGCEAYYPSEISGGSDRRGAPLDGRRPAVSPQREWTGRAAGGWHQGHAQHGAGRDERRPTIGAAAGWADRPADRQPRRHLQSRPNDAGPHAEDAGWRSQRRASGDDGSDAGYPVVG